MKGGIELNEFTINGDYIVLDAPYAEAYIPQSIVGDPQQGKPVAYEFGEGFHMTGLFNIRFYKSDTEPRESTKLRTFNYPNVIIMYPSMREVATLKLDKDMDEDKYVILKFYKGDIIMNRKIQKSSKNCEEFMDLLIKGKLPKGLSYTDLYYAWVKNFRINNVDPGVPMSTLQFVISESCRSKEDPMKQFRKVVNNPEVSLTDYKVHNMVDVCSNSSVMNALIFERFGEMLTSSLNMSKSGVKQNTSPLETVLSI